MGKNLMQKRITNERQSNYLHDLAAAATELTRNIPTEVAQLYSSYPTRDRASKYATLEAACSDMRNSLVDVDNRYGKETSVIWLIVQLVACMKFTGQRLSMRQLEATARQMRAMGYHLTMGEVMVFFDRFERGRYERFYGHDNPNAQVITVSFANFIDDVIAERQAIWSRIEAEKQREERKQWAKNAVPPPPGIEERINNFIKNKKI